MKSEQTPMRLDGLATTCLWRKYAVTARQIEAQRDAATMQLQKFLVELGYVA